MRMDDFIHNKKKIKKKFDQVFFSFGPGFPGLGGNLTVNIFPKKNYLGFHNLSEKTHLEVILFAKKNPKTCPKHSTKPAKNLPKTFQKLSQNLAKNQMFL